MAEVLRKLREENVELTKQKNELVEKYEKQIAENNADNVEHIKRNVDIETREEIADNRRMKRKLQKERKQMEDYKYPKLSHDIMFKEKDSDLWKSGTVVKTFKKTSKNKSLRHIDIEGEGRVQYDFEKDIDEWKENQGTEDLDDTNEGELSLEEDVAGSIAFPVKVVVPRKDYKRDEIKLAMKSEIAKFEKFGAFEEVDDEGQRRIPIRWVVTEQPNDGKNEPYKARLCMRGDLEDGKEDIRADSPTASKDTLKLALIIAANEGLKVKSIDIKSAFLQGKSLSRKIYVSPPPEANRTGKLWLLNQAAYGILDGGRMFYLKLSRVLVFMMCIQMDLCSHSLEMESFMAWWFLMWMTSYLLVMMFLKRK